MSFRTSFFLSEGDTMQKEMKKFSDTPFLLVREGIVIETGVIHITYRILKKIIIHIWKIA